MIEEAFPEAEEEAGDVVEEFDESVEDGEFESELASDVREVEVGGGVVGAEEPLEAARLFEGDMVCTRVVETVAVVETVELVLLVEVLFVVLHR